MSAIEETKSEISVSASAPVKRARVSPLTWLLNLLSSVRFCVMLLVLLATASMIGMLIIQVNVDGFDKHYASMTPATKLLFGSLGFFDIYHSWYFNILLLVLSLNLVLASIDRFPGAWQYIKRPKFDVQPAWLRKQPVTTTLKLKGESRNAVAEQVATAARKLGMKAFVTEKGTRTFVFTQKGTWNRLGAYAVHVALLTIFTGGFLTTQLGHTGTMNLRPGAAANQMRETAFQIVEDRLLPSQAMMALPFTVECTDIQQKLIKKDGPITPDNTIDWLTRGSAERDAAGQRGRAGVRFRSGDGRERALRHAPRRRSYIPADRLRESAGHAHSLDPERPRLARLLRGRRAAHALPLRCLLLLTQTHLGGRRRARPTFKLRSLIGRQHEPQPVCARRHVQATNCGHYRRTR